jgi:hypothetical protein
LQSYGHFVLFGVIENPICSSPPQVPFRKAYPAPGDCLVLCGIEALSARGRGRRSTEPPFHHRPPGQPSLLLRNTASEPRLG